MFTGLLFAFSNQDCSQFIRHRDEWCVAALQGIYFSYFACFYHILLCRVTDGMVINRMDIHFFNATEILFSQVNWCGKRC
jgi:hypothetical protein